MGDEDFFASSPKDPTAAEKQNNSTKFILHGLRYHDMQEV